MIGLLLPLTFGLRDWNLHAALPCNCLDRILPCSSPIQQTREFPRVGGGGKKQTTIGKNSSSSSSAFVSLTSIVV